MFDDLKKQSPLAQILFLLLIAAVSIYLFQFVWQFFLFFSDIIVILVTSWVVSFILEPFVEKLNKSLRFPRTTAALLVFAVFFGLLTLSIVLFIPTVTAQVQSFAKVVPKYEATYPAYLHSVTSFTLNLANNSLSYVPSVAGFLFDAFMVFITSFYFVVDKERITKEMYMLVPKKWHSHAEYVQGVIDTTFGSFIRMQIIFGIIAGIATWVIMTAFGLNYAASTSLVAGILTIIPLIGGLLALIPPVLIAFLIDPTKALFVLIALVAMQQVIFNIIAPRVMGKALQLHPVIVLLSFLIGYKVAGGFGVIFAVPVLGVFFVILHNIGHHFLDEQQ